MNNLLAQSVQINGQTITGPLDPKLNSLGAVINTVISFLYPIAGTLLFLYIVWGGFDYLTSRGSPEKLKSAQGKLTAAVVGFVILMASYLIAKLAAIILGLDFGII